MSFWRGTLHLIQFELWRDRFGLLVTLLFAIYLALLIGPLTERVLEDSLSLSMSLTLDIMYIAVFPNLGFVFSLTIFRMWQEDTITKRIARLRAMPITLRQIVIGRYLQMLLTMLVSISLFFAIQYFLSNELQQQMRFVAYLIFSLFWFGYATVVASALVYAEMGFSGRAYGWISLFFLPLYAAAISLIYWGGGNAVSAVLQAAQRGSWWLALLALGSAAAAVLVIGHLLHARLMKRNLLL